MNICSRKILLLLFALGFSSQAMAVGMIWGESNWGEADWGVEEMRDPVPPPEGDVPVSPKVKSITGAETDAGISAGAYADTGTPTFSDAFSAGDYITIIAEISPDSGDVGTNGELVAVLLSIVGGQVEWSYLNTDGNYVSWDLTLPNLGPAEVAEPLEALHAITVFEGELQAGIYRMALGYMADGGPLIFTAKAININVSD
jgi:hypothetical protein